MKLLSTLKRFYTISGYSTVGHWPSMVEPISVQCCIAIPIDNRKPKDSLVFSRVMEMQHGLKCVTDKRKSNHSFAICADLKDLANHYLLLSVILLLFYKLKQIISALFRLIWPMLYSCSRKIWKRWKAFLKF